MSLLIAVVASALLGLGLFGVVAQNAQYNGGGVIHDGCHFSAYYDRNYQLVVSTDVLCYQRGK